MFGGTQVEGAQTRSFASMALTTAFVSGLTVYNMATTGIYSWFGAGDAAVQTVASGVLGKAAEAAAPINPETVSVLTGTQSWTEMAGSMASNAAGTVLNFTWNSLPWQGKAAMLLVGAAGAAYLYKRYQNAHSGVNVTNNVTVNVHVTGKERVNVTRKGDNVDVTVEKKPTFRDIVDKARIAHRNNQPV